jgi:hypothetical protein
VRLIKSESKHNTILFVALVPDEEDRNGDIMDVDEITKTAHEFVMNLSKKKINIDHEENSDIEDEEYDYVESYIMPCDFTVDEDEELVIPA